MIEITKTDNNSFKFHVKTEDDTVLLTSLPYNSIEEVKEVIDNISLSLQSGLKFERNTNHGGEFLFKVKNTNGKLLGTSQPYNSEAGMENGIKNLKIRLAVLNYDEL